MFVLNRNVSAAYRVIATLVATAVVMWTIGFYATAEAANITDVSDELTDSAPSANSNHLIEFLMSDTGSVTAGTGSIVVTFPTLTGSFDLTGVVAADIDLSIAAADQDLTGVDWTVVMGASTITFNSAAGSAAASEAIIIKIGTNATGGTNQINNPVAILGNESFEIDISAGTDSGHTRVVILDTVLVTASVDTVFDFKVYANAADTLYNALGTATTTIVSTSTTIPFGTLSAYEPEIGSQDLTVQTNAANGFVVTVQSDGAFESSTGADIDDFKDGTVVTNPEAWESPLAGLDVNLENTWGHWGIASEDATTTRTNEFAVDEWAGVTTTATIIFSHTGPADAVTPGIGSTTIAYKVEISALQEAGDDYSTTLTYIATPTF